MWIIHTLDIYISQKTRLGFVNLEGQFQTNPKVKLIKYEISNILHILIFLLFLQKLSNPVLFGDCQCYFKKLLERLIGWIWPYSHFLTNLILIIISFKGSVISFIQNRNQIKDELYTLGVSPSLVSRWRERYSFWSSWGP